ncbi:STAS domain-containing protein [Streptomyces sasae]|uniref:STAS domain-containing protein n=1 Tax=Streptomyces sasae TaxID=1266772 RepID=UPI00292E2078|nr:STAS domain-containing protein [Streptomyces sasae]
MGENHTRSVTYRTARTADGTTVVTLRGELDLLAVPALSAALDALTAGAEPDLIFDLRPVSFVDCTGLGILCRARNRVRARHGRLRLVVPGGAVLRLFRQTGLAAAFEFCGPLPADSAAVSLR